MRIKEIKNQIRRDFTALYECEHCGYTHIASGYDDTNFHQNVIPDMSCPKCGKKANENYRGLAPKYTENQTI
jgi:rubrerythrin